MNKSIQKLYKDRYPELEHRTQEIDYLGSSIRNRKNKTLSKKCIISIKYEESQEDIWQKICQLLLEKRMEKETFAFHKLECLDTVRLQKLIQCIANRSQKKVLLYIPPGYKLNTERQQRERNTCALKVQCKEGEFRETLKDVRNVFRGLSASKAIHRIRSTKDGKMLITIDKSEEVCKSLSEAMDNYNKNLKFNILRGKSKEETLHIRGMDAETTKEEVVVALKEIFGKEDEQRIQVGDLRPNVNDTQAVTVRVEEGTSSKLGGNKMRIGQANCQITIRIELLQCNRCWEYEHKMEDCKGPNQKDAYYKCGESGHAVKSCQNESFCVLCKEKDHSAGSGRCKFFREALAREKKKSRKLYADDFNPESMKEIEDVSQKEKNKQRRHLNDEWLYQQGQQMDVPEESMVII